MSHHQPSRRRLLGPMLMCAALGFLLSIVSVIVGSAIFAHAPFRAAHWTSYDSDLAPPPRLPLRWFRPPPEPWMVAGSIGVSSHIAFVEETMVVQGVTRVSGEADWYSQSRCIAGWPFGATEYHTQISKSAPPASQLHGAGWVRWSSAPFTAVMEIPLEGNGIFKPVTIPLSPRFPGALLNIGFWATVAFAAVSLPGWIRRRRPGACPTCGYQVNNLPICPECGTESRPATT